MVLSNSSAALCTALRRHRARGSCEAPDAGFDGVEGLAVVRLVLGVARQVERLRSLRVLVDDQSESYAKVVSPSSL